MSKTRVRLSALAASGTIDICSYVNLEMSDSFYKLLYNWVVFGKEKQATDNNPYKLSIDCSPLGNKAIVELIGQIKAVLLSEGFEIVEWDTVLEPPCDISNTDTLTMENAFEGMFKHLGKVMEDV